MSNNAFHRPIAVDRAPEGHLCDWCDKRAVRQLTAIGGVYHNQGGYYCDVCGEQFAHAVTKSVSRSITAEGM